MKKYTTLALIGAIVAGVAGLISIDAISATSLVSIQGASDFHESGLMIGHVTYEVRDADGNIKHYVQGDNLITRVGTDCAAAAIFDSSDPVCASVGNFAHIAIGNATGATADPTDIALDVSLGDNGGEIARTGILNAIITPNVGAGTSVVISNSVSPFTFTTLGAAGTTVTQSGLFNQTAAGPTSKMFAIRDLDPVPPSPTGVAVLPADTLAVTWTITLNTP